MTSGTLHVQTVAVKVFGRQRRGDAPFDGALEVGLADRAVIDEYRRAGAVLFCQEPRGRLGKKERQV